MIIISGLVPGPRGVGRLMSHLVRESAARPTAPVRFIFGPAGTAGSDALRNWQMMGFLRGVRETIRGQVRLRSGLQDPAIYRDDEVILLIHFQTVGRRWCQQFMKRRKGPTWLYLMDCGFFCVRAYNHLAVEQQACLRCVGGHWRNAEQCRCSAYPRRDPRAVEFLEDLRQWVQEGRVGLLAQNRIQAELARRHFGDKADVRTIGLWSEDWPELNVQPEPPRTAAEGFDVVFHGASLPAKGFLWALELARHSPDLRFLFPTAWMSRWDVTGARPPNATFTACTWETGLARDVGAARIVLVPSLWSAPIEGALVKSIVLASAVAVADEPTAFSAELPEGLVLRLPKDPAAAADRLRSALAASWRPSPETRSDWARGFHNVNRDLLARLLALGEVGQQENAGLPLNGKAGSA